MTKPLTSRQENFCTVRHPDFKEILKELNNEERQWLFRGSMDRVMLYKMGARITEFKEWLRTEMSYGK